MAVQAAHHAWENQNILLPSLPARSSSTFRSRRQVLKWLPTYEKQSVNVTLGDDDGGNSRLPSEEQETAVIHVQAAFRGYRTRREVGKIYRASNFISETGFLEITAEIKKWRYGWTKLICHFMLWLSAVLTVFLSIVQGEPNRFNQETVLVETMQGITFGPNQNDYLGIQNTDDLKEFVYQLIVHMSRLDPDSSQLRCKPETFKENMCQNESYLISYADECSIWTNGSMFLDNRNRMVVAVIMTQARNELQPCQIIDLNDALVPGLQSKLCPGKITTEPFSPAVESKYFLFQDSFHYNELYEGYPYLIDVGIRNLSPQHSACATRYLFDQLKWIDEKTKAVNLFTMIQNRNGVGAVAASRLQFEFTIGGSVQKEFFVGNAQTARPSQQIPALICATIYLLFILLHIYWYVKSLLSKRHLCAKHQITTLLEALYLALNFVGVIITYIFIVKTTSDTGNSLMAALESLDLTGNVTNIVIDRSGNLIDKLGDFLIPVLEHIETQTSFLKLYSFIFIFMCLATVSFLDFHPEIAFITRTVYNGITELFTFLAVFLLIVVSYAIIGVLLFGSYSESFSTLGNACGILVIAGLAEIEPLVSVIWSDETIARYGTFLGGLYMWTFLVISMLILFNILLSIIVDSYFSYKEAKLRYGILSISESFWLTIKMLSYDLRHQYNFRSVSWCGKSWWRKDEEKNGNLHDATKDNNRKHQDLELMEKSQGQHNYIIVDLKKPHSFFEKIESIHKSMPYPKPAYTYQLRRALCEVVGVRLSDRLIHILRRRTIDLNNSKSERQVEIMFPEHGRSNAYTMELLMRIRDRLYQEEGKRG